MAQTKGGNNESQPATQPKQVCKGRRENQTRTQKKVPKIDNFCQTHHLIKCPYFYGGYIVKRLWQQYIPHQVQTLHLWCCAFFCYNHRRHNHNNPTVPHKNSTHGKETRPETSSRAGPQPHGVPNLSSPSKTNYAWEAYGDPHPIHVIIFLLDKLFKLEALVDPYFLSNIYMF